MQSLLWTLDDKAPKWILSESRIGDSPGLGFRPIPVNISQGPLISLSNKNVTSLKTYINRIDQFLERKFIQNRFT